MSQTQLQNCKSENNATVNAVSRTWRRPVYDVSENADAFNIRVNLPGLNRDAVEISIEDEMLNIVGKRSNPAPEGWRPLRRELPEGDYRLSLRLNVRIDEAKIKAKVEDGVLDLTLPKAEEVKPRKIKVA